MVRALSTAVARASHVPHTQSRRMSPPEAEKSARGSVEEVDVAIFGAGPAGLSTALALNKACPNLKVHVYERAGQLRPSGGSIGLATRNVFAALEALGDDVSEAVKASSLERRDFISVDKDGSSNRNVRQIPSSIIAWYELQRALMSCLPHRDMVSLGCELDQISEEGGGTLVATMRNGRSVRAKLVVGADGNRSACRTFVQGDTQPEYVGAVVWRCFVPGETPFVEVSDSLVLTGNFKKVMMQPVRRDGKVMTYVHAICSVDEARLVELQQLQGRGLQQDEADILRAKLARFAEQLQDFNTDIYEYVREHAELDSVLEHPMYSLDPSSAWVRGRAVLVGDSVHAMPPNLAQGTPMAIEDAVQLASSLLLHGGICDAALTKYETIRRDRVYPIWAESHRQAVGYYQQRSEAENPMKVPASFFETLGKKIMEWEAPPLTAPVAGAAAVRR